MNNLVLPPNFYITITNKFNESKIVIQKELIVNIIIIIIITIITIFYFIYLFNLYLINEKIISIFENNTIKSNANAFLFIGVELFGLSIIILILFIAYFVLNDIIKCINDTKEKYIEDIKEYECNSISWQK